MLPHMLPSLFIIKNNDSFSYRKWRLHVATCNMYNFVGKYNKSYGNMMVTVTFLCKWSITVWCKVLMTFLFAAKLFYLVSLTQYYKIMKAFWTGRNLLYIIVWYLLRELKYSPSAIHHCSSLLISQIISPNIFCWSYSSGKYWNGTGTRDVQISCKNIFGAAKSEGSTFEQI